MTIITLSRYFFLSPNIATVATVSYCINSEDFMSLWYCVFTQKHILLIEIFFYHVYDCNFFLGKIVSPFSHPPNLTWVVPICRFSPRSLWRNLGFVAPDFLVNIKESSEGSWVATKLFKNLATEAFFSDSWLRGLTQLFPQVWSLLTVDLIQKWLTGEASF